MRLVHKFIPKVGSARTLKNNPVHPGLLEVAELERATAIANGGWADYASTISRKEYDAHPGLYVTDTKVVLYDADDPDNDDGSGNFVATRECWAGFLDAPVVGKGTVRLGAGGYAKLADRQPRNWLWADFDVEDRYLTTGPDSDLNYDSDEQIDIEILHRAIKAAVARKTEFKHPSGHSKLTADAEAGDEKIDIGNADGLQRGMQITISGGTLGIIQFFEYAISQGYIVREHPRYGGVSGSCNNDPHAVGSHHCRDLTGTGGDAGDINWPGPDEAEKLAELAAYAQANAVGIDELHYPGMGSGEPHYVPDSDDHMHISFDASGSGAGGGSSITRTVADSYHEGETTVKLTAALGSARPSGTQVTWNPDPEGRWASSAGGWYPNLVGGGLGGVRFDIDFPRGKDHHYVIEIAKANGPDGSKNLLDSFRCNKHRDDVFVDLGNNRDLVLFTFARDHDAEDKNAPRFVARVTNLWTYGPFTTAKTYPTYKIAKDVGDHMGWDTSGVETTTTNGLPFRMLPGRPGDVLDAQTAVEDMMWALFGGEAGPELKLRKYGDSGNRVWLVADEHSTGELETKPQYEKLQVAFKHDHGFEDIVTLTADPNPLAGGEVREYPQVIFQGDRPPPLAIAESFGQPIVNQLAEVRHFGEKDVAYIEDTNNPGVGVPITRIRPGDKARHPHEDNVTLRISLTTIQKDGTVKLTYPDNVPTLERALALRTLLLNRGVRNARATLAGLRLARPVKASGMTGSYKRVETHNGEHNFDAHANWSDVDEDINGKAIFIREYHVKWRYRHKDSGAILQDDDGEDIVIHTHIKLGSLDEDPDTLPSRARLRNIRNPHKYNLEFCVDSISMEHKHSGFTGWKSLGRPTIPTPPVPTSGVQRVDQHTTKVDFDCNEATETDSSGDSMLANGIGLFKIRRYLNGVSFEDLAGYNYKKWIRSRSTHKSWPTPKITSSDVLRTEIYGEDAYGNLSAPLVITTGRGTPPAPTSAPGPFTFDRGGKKGVRGKLPFTYTGTDPDFHIHDFIVEYQAEDHTPTDSDPMHYLRKRVQAGQANAPQQVNVTKLKAGEKVRARYYAQATKNGHLSGPSPWSAVQTVTAPKKPGKATNRRVRKKTRGVLAKWDPPTAWHDGSTEGFSETEIAYYIASLTDSGGTIITDADGSPMTVKTRANHHFFPAEASETGSARGIKVEAFGWDDDFVAGDAGNTATTGLVGGIDLTAGDIPAGSIDYSKLAANMPGSAPPGNYGTPISNGASPPRFYLPSPPAGTWKNGDWCMNLSDSPPHMYRYEQSGGRWYRVADESFYADTIVGGTLSGVIIQGSLFRTAPSGTRVEMSSSPADRISFYNGGSLVGQIVSEALDIRMVGPNANTKVTIFSDEVRLTASGWEIYLDSSGWLNLSGNGIRRFGVPISAQNSGSHDHGFQSNTHSHNVTGRTGVANSHDHGNGTLATDSFTHQHNFASHGGHSHSIS